MKLYRDVQTPRGNFSDNREARAKNSDRREREENEATRESEQKSTPPIHPRTRGTRLYCPARKHTHRRFVREHLRVGLDRRRLDFSPSPLAYTHGFSLFDERHVYVCAHASCRDFRRRIGFSRSFFPLFIHTPQQHDVAGFPCRLFGKVAAKRERNVAVPSGPQASRRASWRRGRA